ncbi:hypothetical protein [Burkholderia sp. Ac-20344]|uniref:hypothetical protein n=1 Tax=Burkholderia sp. Ac-20344 TaxID=2703890 RepID=UPI00197C4EDC|nr:hypothetical protein [Burkholderia sp. Ac-20344]MBN3835111.1 hypothetical protein [Burkholderia sp. Ac-20344]
MRPQAGGLIPKGENFVDFSVSVWTPSARHSRARIAGRRRHVGQRQPITADDAYAEGAAEWAAEYAALAGNQRVEFLDPSWPRVNRKAGHIRVKRAKQRGKKRGEVIEQIEITPPLAEFLDRVEAVRGDKDCLYVFRTKFGAHYTRDGIKGAGGSC